MDWIELRERVLTLPTLEKKLQHLKELIFESKSGIEALLKAYEKNRGTVDRLRGESFSGFLFKLVGRYEDKLDKEQRAEIDAKLEYDRAVNHLEHLIEESHELESRIAELKEDEKSYTNELTSRRKRLFNVLSDADIAEYGKIETTYAELISQRTEVLEAQTVADRAEAAANSALSSLKSAQTWATIDAFSKGGFISHMAKYSHIDDAEMDCYDLHHYLGELRDELADVHGLDVSCLSGIRQISSTQRAVDLWFDNIFTDLAVRDKIIGNADEVEFALKSVRNVQVALKKKYQELGVRLDKNRKDEETFLITKNF